MAQAFTEMTPPQLGEEGTVPLPGSPRRGKNKKRDAAALRILGGESNRVGANVDANAACFRQLVEQREPDRAAAAANVEKS